MSFAQTIPFHAEELFWNPWQTGRLAGIFLVLTLPFLFAATAVCMTFQRFSRGIGAIYAADLAGAGTGSLAVMLLLFVLLPQNVLAMVALAGVAAALCAAAELRIGRRGWAVTTVGALLAALLSSAVPLHLRPSPYKEVEQLLRIDGTRVVHQRSTPLGWLSVVESQDVPLRHAPGLGLHARREPPPQVAVFTDGGGLTAITRFIGIALF